MRACMLPASSPAHLVQGLLHDSNVSYCWLQIFFVFGLVTNLVVSALLVLGGSAVITAVTGVLAVQLSSSVQELGV